MIAGERDPFVLGEWLIRYNIFAGNVFELPSISPARGVALFKLKDCSGRVRWDVLNIRRMDRRFRSRRHKDLHGLVGNFIPEGRLPKKGSYPGLPTLAAQDPSLTL
jgi:hypothetical protein